MQFESLTVVLVKKFYLTPFQVYDKQTRRNVRRKEL